jgi:hypothetical protein
MNVRRAFGTAVMMASLLCATGWAQPRRGPEGFRPRPEFRPERHVVPHLPGGARHIIIGGRPYWVYGSVYYELGDDGYVVVSAPVIRVLPRYYRVVVIHGVVYYVADDIYYRPTPEGYYVVVERPAEPAKVIAAAPETDSTNITLYVPKKDGDGFTPVILKKIDGGFLGPQGEFYPTMPRVSLLTEMYGIPEILRETASDNIYFIHVPNKDGQTFTRVELTRRNGGFVGPQGEFYPTMPSVAHLAEMYGVAKETAPAAPAQTQDKIHVQVARKNGQGTVDVVLKKRDNGYIGPQGELYPEMPSASQLTEVYGAQ